MSPMADTLLFLLAALPPAVLGWSFTIDTYPTQCTPLQLTWSGGESPHTFTFLGLSGVNTSYTSWDTGYTMSAVPDADGTLELQEYILPFAAGTPLVIVGSDSTGFASGGTSDVYIVQPSADDSCVETNDNTSYLNTVPGWTDPPAECQPMLSVFLGVAYPVEIVVVMPGGESFVVETPAFAANSSVGDGLEAAVIYWEMNVPAGTTLAYLVSDANGMMLFTSGLTTVAEGNTSCVAEGMWASTAAPAAGALSTTPPSQSTGSGGGNNVGAIVGGVHGGVGGLIVIAGFALFLVHRYNRRRRQERLKAIKLVTYPVSKPPRLEGKNTWQKMDEEEGKS